MADQPLFQSHKTITGRKRYKRYFTGHDTGKPGKGSWRRDTLTSEEQFAHNWCLAFGHRFPEGGEFCTTCGKDVELLALLLMTAGWEHDRAMADARVLLWYFGPDG